MEKHLLTTRVLVLLDYYGHYGEGIINYNRKEVIKKLQADIMAKQNFTFTTTISLSQHPRGLRLGFCDRSLAGIERLNPALDIDIFLLCVLFVVRLASLPRVNHSSKRVLPNVVCLSVIVKPR